MGPGVRQRSRRSWPRGLREKRPGYYTWEPPADVLPYLDNQPPAGGYVLGRVSLQEAIAQVTEAYLAIHGRMTERRLVHSVQGAPDTFAEWSTMYLTRLGGRDVADDTMAIARRRVARLCATFGHLSVAAVSTRNVADYLATLAATPRTQQAMRSLLLDVFREAVAAGWCASNPVQPTRAPRVTTQRGRLSLEGFLQIHAWSAAHQPAWATRALELAIATAQRRADIAALQFSQVRDGHVWVTQGKSGAKIAIPLSLRLNTLGWTIGDVIGRCRDAVVSRYVLHHSRHCGRAKPGDKVRDMTLAKMFSEARDAAGVSVDGKMPPTFHELRSLSLRLYHDQGINAQALAGHKSADMTAVYRDVRGDEWVTVGESRG